MIWQSSIRISCKTNENKKQAEKKYFFQGWTISFELPMQVLQVSTSAMVLR